MKKVYFILIVVLSLMGCSVIAKENSFTVIAHRGASTIAPEHTMIAYKKAIENGADYIEIDLRMTKDGELVSIHDNTVDRTTNGQGNVGDFTLAELKKLDAGSWFSEEFAGETIPTLDEIFAEFGNTTKYYIETRLVDKKTVMEKYVENLIEKHDIKTENIILQSWYENSLREFDNKFTKVKLFDQPFDEIDLDHVKTYADGIGIEASYLTKEIVNEIQNADLTVHVFFFENEKEATQEVISFGVDGIFTNFVQDYGK